MCRNLLISAMVVVGLALASPANAACGGASPNLTAGNFADFSDCAANYTEGDTITITSNITMTGNITFSRGGVTITAATECGVTLSHNAGSATLLTITRDLTHDTIIKNLQFSEGASHTNGTYIVLNGPAPPATGYNPVVVRDNCFAFTDGNLSIGIRVQLVGGAIIAGNTFTATSTGNGITGGRSDQAINFTADSYDDSWTTPHTMGTADTDGLQNTYVETNAFSEFLAQAIDTSGNARVVFRYNTMTSSATAAHGADTGADGMRHVEYYNNTFIHDYRGDAGTGCLLTLQLSRSLNIRGGTAVVTDNDFTLAETDSCWGASRRIQMEEHKLRITGSPYPCWGAGNGTYPTYAASGYPAYHQIGRGTYDTNIALTAVGASDPVYIWNNLGGALTVYIGPETPNECGAGTDPYSDYIQLDRDYFLSARPGYTKYTYPHPLLAGSAPSASGSARKRARRP